MQFTFHCDNVHRCYMHFSNWIRLLTKAINAYKTRRTAKRHARYRRTLRKSPASAIYIAGPQICESLQEVDETPAAITQSFHLYEECRIVRPDGKILTAEEAGLAPFHRPPRGKLILKP